MISFKGNINANDNQMRNVFYKWETLNKPLGKQTLIIEHTTQNNWTHVYIECFLNIWSYYRK